MVCRSTHTDGETARRRDGKTERDGQTDRQTDNASVFFRSVQCQSGHGRAGQAKERRWEEFTRNLEASRRELVILLAVKKETVGLDDRWGGRRPLEYEVGKVPVRVNNKGESAANTDVTTRWGTSQPWLGVRSCAVGEKSTTVPGTRGKVQYGGYLVRKLATNPTLKKKERKLLRYLSQLK